MQTHVKINRKVAFLSSTVGRKILLSPTLPPANFCDHSLKLLSPTLPKLMNWILLSPPPLSSDPDNPPKFGTCIQEIFTVTKIIPRVPPVYRLRDYADDEIEGMFYAKELQKVHKSDDIYKIEKIIAEKKENGKIKVLVKWLGYDKKFNSWIPKSELRKL